MALSFSNKKEPLSAYSLAGLADIVLLLLIFFLLTSNFIPQFGIQVNLPQAEASAPMESQYVTVVITDEGRYYVDQTPVAADELLNAIRLASQDKTFMAVRADQNATIGQFARVASIAKALDLRINMATERAGLQPR